MRKIFLSGALLLSTATVFAQKNEVREAEKAFTLFTMGAQKDAAKAVAALGDGLKHADVAVANEKTANDPEAWAYKSALSAALAYVDSTNTAGSLKYAQNAQQALAKVKQLDTKGSTKSITENATKYLDAAYRTQGVKAYNAKDYKNAYTLFEGLTVLNPNDTSMYLNAGVTAKMNKDYPNMVKNYTKYVTFNTPEAKSVYYDLINAHFEEMKDTVGALKILDEASGKFPDETNFTAMRAQYYLGKGDDAKAEELVDKLIAKDPNNAQYNITKGNMYFNQAFAMQKQRQAIDPKKTKEFDAATAKMNGLLDKAIPYYKKAADNDKKDPSALKMLKQIYTFKNDKANADAIAKQLEAYK